MQQRDQLAARELGERRDRLEIGVDAVEQVLGQTRQRRAQPTDAPRAAQAVARPGPG